MTLGAKRIWGALVVLTMLPSSSVRAEAAPDFWTCLANAPIDPAATALDACRGYLPMARDGGMTAWALNALGNGYLRAHQPARAVDLYRAALAVVPEKGRGSALLAANLALALSDADPDGSIGWLHRSIAADPTFPDAHVNLALSLLRQGPSSGPDPAAAEAHLRQALEILAQEEGPEATRAKARIQLYLGDLLFDRVYAELSTDWAVGERAPPAAPPPAVSVPSAPGLETGNRATLLPAPGPVPSQQRPDAAVADCTTYDCILGQVGARPSSGPLTPSKRAWSLSGLTGGGGAALPPPGDGVAPAADWRVGYEQSRRARPATEAERFRPAAECYREAIARDPWLTDARTNYGNLLKETGRLEAAAEQFRGSYCRDNADFVALSNLGQSLFQLGRCAEARRTLAQVRRLRSAFMPGEDEGFSSHFLTTEPVCISRIVDNPQMRLTSMSHLYSEACGETLSALTFWRSPVAFGPFDLPVAWPDPPAGMDGAVVRLVATRFTRDPEPRILAHFGGGVVVLREADSALIATAYHTLSFPGCVPTPAVNADDAVQSEADLIRVQFLADPPLEREARIVWRAIGPGKVEDLALLRVTDVPAAVPAAKIGQFAKLEIGSPIRMRSWSQTGERRTIATDYLGAIDGGRRLAMSDHGFQPGDSGAPVFGPSGAVVGLVAGAEGDESGTGRIGGQAIPIQPIANALFRLSTATCLPEEP